MQNTTHSLPGRRFKYLTVRGSDGIRRHQNDATYTIRLNNLEFLQERIKEITPVSICFPHLFYNIRTGINDTIMVKTALDGDFVPLVFPEGYYNVDAWWAQLVSLMSARTNPIVITPATPALTPLSNLIVITGDVAFQIDWTNSTLSNLIGWTPNSGVTPLLTVHTAPFPPHFNLPDVVQVSSTLSQSNSISTSEAVTSILDTISLANTSFGSYVSKYYDTDISGIVFPEPRLLNEFSITLNDGMGNKLEIPENHEFHMTLKFWFD